jgi:hypothetical protein
VNQSSVLVKTPETDGDVYSAALTRTFVESIPSAHATQNPQAQLDTFRRVSLCFLSTCDFLRPPTPRQAVVCILDVSQSLAAKSLCSELLMSLPLQHKPVLIAAHRQDLLPSVWQKLKQDNGTEEKVPR